MKNRIEKVEKAIQEKETSPHVGIFFQPFQAEEDYNDYDDVVFFIKASEVMV